MILVNNEISKHDKFEESDEIPSAEWGWSYLDIKVIYIGGVFSAIFMICMMYGNHIGNIENWILFIFAILIFLVIGYSIWLRK